MGRRIRRKLVKSTEKAIMQAMENKRPKAWAMWQDVESSFQNTCDKLFRKLEQLEQTKVKNEKPCSKRD